MTEKQNTTIYQCPICHVNLNAHDKSYICDNNHHFDKAKEGYVNLLPVQFKQSKNPGDNKSMVNARRDFLEKGYYQPLVNCIKALYLKFTNGEGNFVDAGCGEGFYTHQHNTESNQVYGVDIAKEAVKKAAKKYKECQFNVATLSHLPFKDASVRWIMSIYAPILEQEFTRLLESNGYLLTVTPAPNHLYELKSLIYQDVQKHNIDKEPIEHLTLVHQEQLNYTMKLNSGNDTLNLLMMTPFAFKATEAIKEQIAETENFQCQAEFLIKLYKNLNNKKPSYLKE